ncbi:MAG: hypothetical protein JG782_900 [Anaerophaga sp.]|nr:hypothetical protein [Anaerophaga sp.]MDN5292211.1 hypothetical protein [Anaerophaga sp.]
MSVHIHVLRRHPLSCSFHQYKIYLSYWSDGTHMQVFIHILAVVNFAMLVSSENGWLMTIILQI